MAFNMSFSSFITLRIKIDKESNSDTSLYGGWTSILLINSTKFSII